MPRQDYSYGCGGFVCLYAAYIAKQQPFIFTQADVDDVRMWMVPGHRLNSAKFMNCE